MSARIVLLGCCGLSLSTVAQAATIRVPEDRPTIAGALAIATAGDEVVLACGIYHATNLWCLPVSPYEAKPAPRTVSRSTETTFPVAC